MYKHSKSNEVKRKLKKVAAFIFLEKTLRKCYNSLRLSVGI